jgi:hypothetical protein
MASLDIEIMEQTIPVEDINSSTELSRNVIESMSKQVRLVDSDNGLDLFCYIRCDSKDSELLKKCRGVVFNGDKIVMNGFPYTYESTEENKEQITSNLESVFDKCLFYDSHEGSLIRMFNFNDKWYISTNRKLDANKSKWSSKESFGFFFTQALEAEYKSNERFRTNLSEDESKSILERFQEVLDKNKQYMFLLLNNEQNRIVCSSSETPTVFHVGTFINGNLSMEEDIYVRYPNSYRFDNLEDMLDCVNAVNIYHTQGIIVFAPNNLQYKIYNKEYHDLYKVRGNEPSIKFRYLQVRMDKRYNNLLHYLYPNFSKVFDDYENNIYGIGKKIYKAYFDRFIRNEYVTVPTEEFMVIRACHDWHLEDRVSNKINLNKVMEILNEQTPTNINKMIRRYYLELQNKEKGIKTEVTDVNKKPGDFKKKSKYKPLLNRNKTPKEPESETTEVVDTSPV